MITVERQAVAASLATQVTYIVRTPMWVQCRDIIARLGHSLGLWLL